MATIISLKRRIQAAKNISKTTKAFQMIAASKLKRAQEAALSTRPYVTALNDLTKNTTAKVDKKTFSHPYLRNSAENPQTLVIILGPDKGLCGGLVSNLVKEFINYNKENRNQAHYVIVGNKIARSLTRLSDNIVASFPFGTSTPTFDIIYPIMKIVDEYFVGNQIKEVKIMFTEFKSFFTQKPVIKTLLPIKIMDEKQNENTTADICIFEPNANEILTDLIKHHIEMSLYHSFLECFLSEQASRMLAMQNATTNANDIIDALILEYNKTRQAKITNELLDITGAAIAAA